MRPAPIACPELYAALLVATAVAAGPRTLKASARRLLSSVTPRIRRSSSIDEPAGAPPAVAEPCEIPAGMFGLDGEDAFSGAGVEWAERIDLEGLIAFWRARYRHKPVDHVAAALRWPRDTVKKWFAGAVRPNGLAMVAIVCVWGPEALAAMLPHDAPAWIAAMAQAAKRARLEAEFSRLEAALGRTGAPL